VLGLEVVLPDGRVLDGLKPLRKDNTGYDLRDLFIGAEGTLGIITAAACKLFSRPAWALTAFVGVPEPHAAVTLLSRLRTFTSDAVTTFELIPRVALDLVLQHIPSTSDPLDRPHPWYVLVEIGMGRSAAAARDSIETELAAAMEAGEITDAAIAASEAQREMFWRLRETIPEAQSREGASIKHDISVTTSELPRFIVEGGAVVAQLAPGARLVSYGHLGDGNLHFNLSPARGGNSEEFLRLAPQVNRAVHDLVARYGGSFSAEHGIGQLKRAELIRYKNPVAIELMRSIKRAIDPRGIMNPGKVL
jgi:FAD/FMN-containing dehydrogenase